MSKRFVLAVAVTALVTASRHGIAAQKIQHNVHRDIPYAEPANPRQMLDVYSAAADGAKRPVVFWIHGGGWAQGDKTEVHAKPLAFISRGFVFASTNYRFFPNATINDMARDVAKAIRWVRDHAADYGGDPDRFLVMGWSAGAQLAALVCTDERYLKAEGLSFAMIRGCVPFDGDTYDVQMQIRDVLAVRPTEGYSRKFGDAANQKEVSAVTHIGKGKGIPPFAIVHITPHAFTPVQAQRLAKALQDAEVPARVVPAEGKTHNTLNTDFGLYGDEATAAVFQFVAEVLQKRSRP
jgi:acetyl esterase/lipase